MFFFKKSNDDVCVILNLQKTNYVISNGKLVISRGESCLGVKGSILFGT
jgi:hypothetical protein